jgi:hypothetical protein
VSGPASNTRAAKRMKERAVSSSELEQAVRTLLSSATTVAADASDLYVQLALVLRVDEESLLARGVEIETHATTVRSEMAKTLRRVSVANGYLDEARLRGAAEEVLRGLGGVVGDMGDFLTQVALHLDLPGEALHGQRLAFEAYIPEVSSMLQVERAESFLFEDAALVERACVAIKWKTSRCGPVFGQCCNRLLAGSRYCALHAKKAALTVGQWRQGDWDPSAGHASLSCEKRNEGLKEATKRAAAFVRPREAGPLASGQSISRPSEVGMEECIAKKTEPSQNKQSFTHKLCEQKPYVSIPLAQRGDLRVFSDEPHALPPHPCMLCHSDFATRDEWHGHVDAEHHGLFEYRKRLFFGVWFRA